MNFSCDWLSVPWIGYSGKEMLRLISNVSHWEDNGGGGGLARI